MGLLALALPFKQGPAVPLELQDDCSDADDGIFAETSTCSAPAAAHPHPEQREGEAEVDEALVQPGTMRPRVRTEGDVCEDEEDDARGVMICAGTGNASTSTATSRGPEAYQLKSNLKFSARSKYGRFAISQWLSHAYGRNFDLKEPYANIKACENLQKYQTLAMQRGVSLGKICFDVNCKSPATQSLELSWLLSPGNRPGPDQITHRYACQVHYSAVERLCSGALPGQQEQRPHAP